MTQLREIIALGEISARRNFGRLFAKRGYSHGVEVGTHRGEFASTLLRSHNGLHLHCVDPYTKYDSEDPASNGDRKSDLAYCRRRLRTYTPRYSLHIQPSPDAAEAFGDLDFVYIDGCHRYRNVRADLEAWYGVIRPGGMLAGHDIVCPGEKNGGWGREVQPAVFEFAEKHQLAVYLVPETGEPWSYYMEKPL